MKLYLAPFLSLELFSRYEATVRLFSLVLGYHTEIKHSKRIRFTLYKYDFEVLPRFVVYVNGKRQFSTTGPVAPEYRGK